MKQKVNKEEQLTVEQLEKERIIKFAASLGITLTVSDKPSEQRYVPEKYQKANEVISKMDWTNVKK